MREWYDIKALADATAEVWIYDEIGESFDGSGVGAKRFVEELNALEVSDIALHINSPGGSVFDGQAIFTALRRHPARITTYVDGIAASIASVIALAGDEVIMPANTMLMIHDPWGMSIGSSDDMRRMADALDKVRETILNVYDERSALTREELSDLMRDETWMTAEEAAEYGFATTITPAIRMAAHFDLSRFRNAPRELLMDATARRDAEDQRDEPAEGEVQADTVELPPQVKARLIKPERW